jgi:Family of unknown function (DUF6502)
LGFVETASDVVKQDVRAAYLKNQDNESPIEAERLEQRSIVKFFGKVQTMVVFCRGRTSSDSKVPYAAKQDSDKPKQDDVRTVAKRALLQLLEPLAGFVSDSGLSTGELHAIFREAAVRSAAAKQLEVSGRINISGIAATTGIPRADVSRILKVTQEAVEKTGDRQQQSTNRILAAWHKDPKFTGPNGQPADLKMYGRGPSFETLAKKYGLGIPPRAVLDELIRTGAIELLATQKIRAKTSMAGERGMSASVIKAFGDRATELLSTMLLNMRQPEAPKFVASVSGVSILSTSLPLFRKELSIKGANFLADVQESLTGKPSMRASNRRERGSARVGVTIFYHESLDKKNAKRGIRNKRRNFRREI